MELEKSPLTLNVPVVFVVHAERGVVRLVAVSQT
jgi:hypothetical protein